MNEGDASRNKRVSWRNATFFLYIKFNFYNINNNDYELVKIDLISKARY